MTPDGITTPYASMSFNTVSAAPVPHALNGVGQSLRCGGRSVRLSLHRRPGRPVPAHRQQLRSLESICRRGLRSRQRRGRQHLFLRPSTQRGIETTRRAAAPPARPPRQAWPTAAFINAASLLTFDARFISPLLPYAQIFGTAPGEMVRICGACLCRFDPALAQYDSTGTVPTTWPAPPCISTRRPRRSFWRRQGKSGP